MNRPLFLPSPRQIAWLATLGALAISYAFYMRYQVIEQSAVGIGCDITPGTWLCASRRAAIALFTPSVFGWVALVASLLNLARPSFVLFAIGLVAAAFGIVLYNVALSALAIALLVLSLARRAPEPE
jgi:hypothetical protein